MTPAEKANKTRWFCKHEFCKKHCRSHKGYADNGGRSRHQCNMKLTQHKLCAQQYPDCATCFKLETKGKLARNVLNSNLDTPPGPHTPPDDDNEPDEQDPDPMNDPPDTTKWFCPLCKKRLNPGEHAAKHLRYCANKALDEITTQNPSLSYAERIALFNNGTVMDVAVYDQARLRWCPGQCGKLIKSSIQFHHACGWKAGIPANLCQPAPSKNLDRPSDMIPSQTVYLQVAMLFQV